MKQAVGKLFRGMIASAILVFTTAFVPPALAEDAAYSEFRDTPSAGAMAIDAVVVRPMGFFSTVVGSVLFVATLPFSALGGNVDEAGQRLVAEPARMTFVRPLGEFDSD